MCAQYQFVLLFGSFEVGPPIKIKFSQPLIYSEIKAHNLLALMETDSSSESPINSEVPVKVEASELIFWKGELRLEESKEQKAKNKEKPI